MVPKLVDEAEDLTEVIQPSTANNRQDLVEDADDDVVDPAASLLQMLRIERAEALFLWSLCAFSQPSTVGDSQVGAVRVWYVSVFTSLVICVSDVSQDIIMSHEKFMWRAFCVHGALSTTKEGNWSSTSNMTTPPVLFFVASGRNRWRWPCPCSRPICSQAQVLAPHIPSFS